MVDIPRLSDVQLFLIAMQMLHRTAMLSSKVFPKPVFRIGQLSKRVEGILWIYGKTSKTTRAKESHGVYDIFLACIPGLNCIAKDAAQLG